mgnify:CR=1 FL=1
MVLRLAIPIPLAPYSYRASSQAFIKSWSVHLRLRLRRQLSIVLYLRRLFLEVDIVKNVKNRAKLVFFFELRNVFAHLGSNFAAEIEK